VLSIQSIPLLCQRPIEDRLVWPFTQSAVFTIKSGYKFLTQENEALYLKVQDDGQDVWKKVWGLAVQSNYNKQGVW